jgi:hypothetical protein
MGNLSAYTGVFYMVWLGVEAVLIVVSFIIGLTRDMGWFGFLALVIWVLLLLGRGFYALRARKATAATGTTTTANV